jgi:hypothetical protein
MNQARLILVLLGLCRFAADASETPGATQPSIIVDGSRIVHTMCGGLGASWHAIEPPIPVVGGRSHGGSGWGGCPPVEDDGAWR